MEDNISPEAKALTAFIEASVQDLQNNRPSSEPLLFLGNWNESFPRLIFEDPVLKPVDRNVWAAIKLKAANNQATAFPSYEELQAACNIEGKATIARAIAILRATRWITLCKRVRKNGRNAGNIYALHDEPLQLTDTLSLDPEYIPFLEKAAQEHHHQRAKEVCQAVLRTIDADVDANKDIMTPESGLNRRAEAISVLQRISALNENGIPPAPDQCFYSINTKELLKLAGNSTRVQKLNPDFQGSKIEPGEKSQKNQSSIFEPSENTQSSKTEPCTQVIDNKEISIFDNNKTGRASSVFELRSSSSSSSSKKNTTTTLALRFPEELSENNRRIAIRYLKKVPENKRQAVLDALEVKFQAIKQEGGCWKYGPIPYLRKLCNTVLDGTFVEIPVTAQRQTKLSQERARERVELMTQIQGLDELMKAPGAAVDELRKIRDRAVMQLRQTDEGGEIGDVGG